MATYKVVDREDPLLRKISKPVPEITPNVLKLIRNMLETMYEYNGVGLAAPQVGVLKRIIVVDIGEGPIALINPEILERSGSQTGEEGCLSCPDMWGDVERAKYIKIKGISPEGKEVIIEAEDYLARAFQHECDHLDGILFIDKVHKLKVKRR